MINKPERLWVFDALSHLEIFDTTLDGATRQAEYFEEQTGIDFALHPEWQLYQRERMTNAEAAVAEAVAATERARIAAAFAAEATAKADAAVRSAKLKAAKRAAVEAVRNGSFSYEPVEPVEADAAVAGGAP